MKITVNGNIFFILATVLLGILVLSIELYRASRRPPGYRARSFLGALGLPTNKRSLLLAIFGLVIFGLVSAIAGWVVAIIVVVIFAGLFNGFFTQRKRP